MSARYSLSSVVRIAVAACVALVVALPLVNTVLGGFKSNGQLMNHPFGWPDPPLVDNYLGVLRTGAVWRQLGNSAVVTIATVALVLVAASMAAFVFARFSFRGRDLLFNIFTLGLLFPLSVAILPLFVQLRQL